MKNKLFYLYILVVALVGIAIFQIEFFQNTH